MSGLSSEPYKGTRDFYPSDMRVRQYIFDVWRRVVERYGYERYETRVLIDIIIILIALVTCVQFIGEWLSRRVNHRLPR